MIVLSSISNIGYSKKRIIRLTETDPITDFSLHARIQEAGVTHRCFRPKGHHFADQIRFHFRTSHPFFANVLLKIEFLRLKKAGPLIAYSVKTGRISKYFYEFNVHVVLDSGRVEYVLKNRLSEFIQNTLSGLFTTKV